MKSTRETSVRRLSSGSYVVSGVGTRSAVTGRFVGSGSGSGSGSTKTKATAADGATAKDSRKK